MKKCAISFLVLVGSIFSIACNPQPEPFFISIPNPFEAELIENLTATFVIHAGTRQSVGDQRYPTGSDFTLDLTIDAELEITLEPGEYVATLVFYDQPTGATAPIELMAMMVEFEVWQGITTEIDFGDSTLACPDTRSDEDGDGIGNLDEIRVAQVGDGFLDDPLRAPNVTVEPIDFNGRFVALLTDGAILVRGTVLLPSLEPGFIAVYETDLSERWALQAGPLASIDTANNRVIASDCTMRCELFNGWWTIDLATGTRSEWVSSAGTPSAAPLIASDGSVLLLYDGGTLEHRDSAGGLVTSYDLNSCANLPSIGGACANDLHGPVFDNRWLVENVGVHEFVVFFATTCWNTSTGFFAVGIDTGTTSCEQVWSHSVSGAWQDGNENLLAVHPSGHVALADPGTGNPGTPPSLLYWPSLSGSRREMSLTPETGRYNVEVALAGDGATSLARREPPKDQEGDVMLQAMDSTGGELWELPLDASNRGCGAPDPPYAANPSDGRYDGTPPKIVPVGALDAGFISVGFHHSFAAVGSPGILLARDATTGTVTSYVNAIEVESNVILANDVVYFVGKPDTDAYQSAKASRQLIKIDFGG